MEFSEFEKQIVKISKLELPGETSHLEMAPIERLLELKRKARDKNSARKAAVLALFYPSRKERFTNLVLILRKTYKGVHSAQVGFPGGKVENEDIDKMDTALRETEEEIGVTRDKIKVLKELTEIYIPPSNFFVQPFFGVSNQELSFIPQDSEVEAIIEVPLTQFMDDDVLVTKTLSTSYAKEIQVPAFVLNKQIVWGATAMMLNEIRQMLKQII
jgi:8-oxo-dGTP pyrophosphatase MutT (NUDIX family)